MTQVNWTEFEENPEKLELIKLGTCKISTYTDKKTGAGGQYKTFPIQYQYPGASKAYPLLVEGPHNCPVRGVFDGTKDKDGAPAEQSFGDKKNWAALVTFPETEEIQVRWKNVILAITRRICVLLEALKAELVKTIPAMRYFTADTADAVFKKMPVFRPKDSKTEQEILDADYSMYWNFIDFSKPDKPVERGQMTEITDTRGELVCWDFLLPFRFTMQPLLRFDRVFFGAQNVIQVKLISGFITSVPELKQATGNRQAKSLQAFRERMSEEELAQLDEGIEQKIIAVATAAPNAFGDEDESADASGSTFDGIAPLGDTGCDPAEADYSALVKSVAQ